MSRNQEEQIKIKNLSFVESDGLLYEQILQNEQTCFLIYDPETEQTFEEEEITGVNEIFKPIIGDELEKGAVLLPSGSIEYESTERLLIDIEAHIYKYLDVSDNFRKQASFYILQSWLVDRLNTTSYLRLIGDSGCGKSRGLDVIGRLLYKPLLSSGALTSAVLFRLLDKWQGSIIIDECDFPQTDEAALIVKLLNSSFEKGRPTMRCDKNNPSKIETFNFFGCKILATRKRFKDYALESRCLTQTMTETDRDDIPPTLTAQFFKEQEELRNKLLLFRFRNYFKTNAEEAANFNLSDIKLEPRLKQIFSSFACVVSRSPEALKELKNFAVSHQKQIIEERAGSFSGRTIEAFLSLIESYLVPVTEVTAVTTVTDSRQIIDDDGQILLLFSASDVAEELRDTTAQKVGSVLKTLGVQSRIKKIHGKAKRIFIYDKQLFAKLKKRYIPESDSPEVTAVTDVTIVTQTDTDTDKLLTPEETIEYFKKEFDAELIE